MIRYALVCESCAVEFDAWFASSEAFDAQAEGAQIRCPECGGAQVRKQIMAPAVSTSSATTDQAFAKFARKARDHIRENCDYVGDQFAGEARAMHYGEIDERPIWGEATPDEAKALKDEGVPAAPLPKPFAPDPPKPKSDLN